MERLSRIILFSLCYDKSPRLNLIKTTGNRALMLSVAVIYQGFKIAIDNSLAFITLYYEYFI